MHLARPLCGLGDRPPVRAFLSSFPEGGEDEDPSAESDRVRWRLNEFVRVGVSRLGGTITAGTPGRRRGEGEGLI